MGELTREGNDSEGSGPGTHNEVSGGQFYGPVVQAGRIESVVISVTPQTPPVQPTEAEREELAKAADRLAEAVKDRWEVDRKRRKVKHADPELLPVGWTTAQSLMDHWKHVRRARAEPGAEPSPRRTRRSLPADSSYWAKPVRGRPSLACDSYWLCCKPVRKTAVAPFRRSSAWVRGTPGPRR
jgi:hypothetical protein